VNSIQGKAIDLPVRVQCDLQFQRAGIFLWNIIRLWQHIRLYNGEIYNGFGGDELERMRKEAVFS
jgi:hypothetical protein